MVTLELSFLAGRFHATPWDRHVNEGDVEWPISPWRIIRSLIAVGYRKLGWTERTPMDQAHRLVELLASEPPHYWLPPASRGHTRHYMPKYRSGLDGKTDKVLDAFVALDRDSPVVVHWPNVELDEELHELLSSLTFRLTFLGRLESWVEARLVEGPREEPNVFPSTSSSSDGDHDRTTILAPEANEDFQRWRSEWLEQQKGGSKKKSPDVPDSLFGAMLVDTGWIRSAGWNRPPGSQWVDYQRPYDAFRITPVPRRHGSRPRKSVAKFSLISEAKQADVRPRLVDAVYLSENMRKALMSLTGKENDGDPSMTFSGKDADGVPLRGHRHAFFLPVDDDGDGRIEGVYIFAPEGFTELDEIALGRLRRLWQHGGRPGLLPVLEGFGEPYDFGGQGGRTGSSPLFSEARTWESRTPFVLSRHPKYRSKGAPRLREDGTWIDGPEDQLRRELHHRGFPQASKIEYIDGTKARGHKVYWRNFTRMRQEGSGSFAGGGYGFSVTFPAPVRGPIALGYGCHFGLGAFQAVK